MNRIYEFDAEIKRLEGKIQWSVLYFPESAKSGPVRMHKTEKLKRIPLLLQIVPSPLFLHFSENWTFCLGNIALRIHIA